MMSTVQLRFVVLSFCSLWLKSHFILETFPWTQHNPQLLGTSLRNVKVEQRLSQLLINHLVIFFFTSFQVADYRHLKIWLDDGIRWTLVLYVTHSSEGHLDKCASFTVVHLRNVCLLVLFSLKIWFISFPHKHQKNFFLSWIMFWLRCFSEQQLATQSTTAHKY